MEKFNTVLLVKTLIDRFKDEAKDKYAGNYSYAYALGCTSTLFEASIDYALELIEKIEAKEDTSRAVSQYRNFLIRLYERSLGKCIG